MEITTASVISRNELFIKKFSKLSVRGNSTDMQDEQDNNSNAFSISRITNRDTDRVIHFLRRFFFKDEPLNIAVGLLDEQANCIELEEYCMNSIPDGVSLMVTNSDEEIIGVCLNGIDKRGNSKDSDDENVSNEECPNLKFRKILNLLSTVNKQSDVFGQFPTTNTIMEIRIISVDDNYRGKGLAKSLVEETKKIAIERGIPLVRVDCSSAFSAKAAASLGFKCVYTLQYSEYLDSNGAPIFSPPPPHSCIKTFVFPLP